jgi:hypothetical protein
VFAKVAARGAGGGRQSWSHLVNTTHELTFLWTRWSLVVGIVMVTVTTVYAVLAWRRSEYRRSIGVLEFIRVLIILMVAIILNQPEWIEKFLPTEIPTIAVFYDDSASMDTRDVVAGSSTGSQPITRRAAIAPLTSDSAWQALSEKYKVVVQPFSTAADGHGTDIYVPLAEAPDKFKNLLGVVLASDGDWNEGKAPAIAAGQLRLKGIPVFAVPVGSPTRLPDIDVLSLDAPTFGIAGKSVRIPFTIDSSLPREYITTVTLRASGGDEVTKELRIAPMSRTSDWIVWKPAQTGDYTLTLEVPKHSDETITDNNKRTAPISIREEKLRVLLVESYPRWEYRYLRNALSRDPGVSLSCLLFHPGLNKVGGGNKDYIKEFPKSVDQLTEYDVVFLGDVGTEDGQLTAEQCKWLKGLVEFQASGLVFMPGMEGREMSLLQTELADLYPVVMDETQPGGWGSRLPSHFELTELGRRSLLTKLADSQDENSEVWESLPGFQWYAPVTRAKAGTEVLCVHKDAANDFGRLPLLVTKPFGVGKVLFMGTDGAWRWRKGVEDKYHYRFWGQVVRWMAYQRNMAKGATMRLYYSPDQPQLHQSVALNANVMETSGEPLAKGDVTAKIVAPSGKTETIRFTSMGDEWGAFSGHFTASEPGKHEVTLSCKQTGATLDTSFFVQGAVIEPIGKAARPEVLKEIADVTHGKVIADQNVNEIAQSLAALPPPEPEVRRLQIWSHPLVMAALVTLLGVFWVARKAAGLI